MEAVLATWVSFLCIPVTCDPSMLPPVSVSPQSLGLQYQVCASGSE